MPGVVGRSGQWREDYGIRSGVRFGPDGRTLDEDTQLAAYSMDARTPDPGPISEVYGGRDHSEKGETDALLPKKDRARCCWCFPPSLGRLWPNLIVPWMIFVLMMYPFGLPWAKVYAAPFIFGLFCFLSVLFMVVSKATSWKLFGLLCLVCLAIGLVIGLDNYTRYLNDYYIYYYSRRYSNVLPSSAPGATKDAGSINFAHGSYVDTSMTVGYRDGDLYCVAPVVANSDVVNATSTQSAVGYWAVGTDCCKARSNFECGDSGNSEVRSGLVVIEEPSHDRKLLNWRTAAKLAATTYGLNMAEQPTFVFWISDTEDAIDNQRTEAQWQFLKWILAGLIPILLLGLALLWRGTATMNRTELAKMHFACAWCKIFCQPSQQATYRPDVVRDLLDKRAYWSGEIAHDWWFFVCNNHDFWGILLCHPHHPFDKWERMLTYFIVSAMTFLAATAITEATYDTNWSGLAPIIVLVFVTLPAKAVVGLMKKQFVRDTELVLDKGASKEEAKRAQRFATILGIVAVLVGVIVAFVSWRILQDVNYSYDYAFRLYVTTELFRAVTQFAAELVVPMFVSASKSEDKKKHVYIGFVHRWFSERAVWEHRASNRTKPTHVDPDLIL